MSPSVPRWAALSLLLALVACGGDGDDSAREATTTTTTSTVTTSTAGAASGDVPPREWAAEVCGALGDWLSELQRIAAEGLGGPAAAGSPAQNKAAYVEVLGRLTTATDTMVERVEGAGAPAVDSGQQLAADFVAPLRDARRLFADGLARAQSLPADDPAAVQREAVAVVTAIQQGAQGIQASLEAIADRYPSPELDEAFNAEPSCSSVGATRGE